MEGWMNVDVCWPCGITPYKFSRALRLLLIYNLRIPLILVLLFEASGRGQQRHFTLRKWFKFSLIWSLSHPIADGNIIQVLSLGILSPNTTGQSLVLSY